MHPSVFSTLTEFDKFLEEHKSELMKIDDRDDLTDAEYEVQEMDIEQADQEVRDVKICWGGGSLKGFLCHNMRSILYKGGGEQKFCHYIWL